MGSHQRQWDENRSPQWKYLFQKDALTRRKTKKEIEKERKIQHEERGEEWKEIIKDKRKITKGKRIRKVSKEELQRKREKTAITHHTS
tara:strand:+ start:130 stop:393 length:264 start_codon:yes stop_codon:yes gene_type:complete